MKVLFVKLKEPMRPTQKPTFMPPMGLWSMRTTLKAIDSKVQVDICDDHLGYQSLESFLSANHYDIIGISAQFSIQHFEYLRVAEIAKKHKALVIGGGFHACSVERPDNVDIVVRGPGEFFFARMLGLEWSDFDQVPHPQFNPIELRRYWDCGAPHDLRSKTLHWISLETSRGCVGNCNFAVSENTWILSRGSGLVRASTLGNHSSELNSDIASKTGMRTSTKYLRRGSKECYRIELLTGHVILATEEHPILSLRIEDRDKTNYAENWVRADQLRINDSVAVSKIDYSKEFEPVTPRDLDFAWILGFYTGDGGTRGDRTGSYLCASGLLEQDLIRTRIENLYGFCPKPNQSSCSKKVVTYWFYSHPFHKEVVEKGISWILKNPNLYREFLKGLIQADGNSCPGGFLITTVKEDLAELIQLMASSVGIMSSKHSYPGSLKFDSKIRWQVYVRDPSLGGLKNSKPLKGGGKLSWRTFVGRNSSRKELDYYNFVKIKKITLEEKQETVDLTVPSEESFWANGTVVHNCGVRNFWGDWNRHTAQYLQTYFGYLRSHGIEELFIEDDNISVQKTRFLRILELFKEFDFKWSTPNGIYVRSIMDPGMPEMLKASGCWRVSLPFETGSPRTAHLMNLGGKWIPSDEADNLVRSLNGVGIETCGFFIIGYPGETEDDVRQTLDYANSLPLGQRNIYIATPYPGTKLYTFCKENGYLVEDGVRLYKDLLYTKGLIKTPWLSPERVEELKFKDREEAIKRKAVNGSSANATGST